MTLLAPPSPFIRQSHLSGNIFNPELPGPEYTINARTTGDLSMWRLGGVCAGVGNGEAVVLKQLRGEY